MALQVLGTLQKGSVNVDVARIGEYPNPVVVRIGINPDAKVPY